MRESSSKGQLGNYYAYTAWQEGVAYSRLTMDPMNQVYAAWLVTIAGKQRELLWSNNRERLGDMVEAALAVCQLVDEYPDDSGHLLTDPNGMWGRLEDSIRLAISNNLSSHYTFSKRPAKKVN